MHRLRPRDPPEALEELDPLNRGSLIHDVQYQLLTELRAAAIVPAPDNLRECHEQLDGILEELVAEYEERLAPAIPKVWQDAVDLIRADVKQWLEKLAEEPLWHPYRFELAFGLDNRGDSDEHSTPDPVLLDCGLQLRGSIDLVERSDGGTLRATDYKTGRASAPQKMVIDGGKTLQPVLYALVLEKLFPELNVEGGRLHYCTARGGFGQRTVRLDDEARRAVERLSEALQHSLAEPFMPAAPSAGACRWCDYQPICGMQEELRVKRKPPAGLERLDQLRDTP